MKKIIIVTTAVLAFSAPFAVFAADHSGHSTDHNSAVAHEEIVDGVKATFNVQPMAVAMKKMGMDMPKGMKETHHVSVSFKDAKSGVQLTDGAVTIKVQYPDKSTQTRELMAMHGHFGADFDFSQNGRYGVMCKFELKDGKIRSTKFWYSSK